MYIFLIDQSAQMASPHLTEEAVYLCTGNPMPKDIEQIAYWLLNESFSTSHQCIHNLSLLEVHFSLMHMLGCMLRTHYYYSLFGQLGRVNYHKKYITALASYRLFTLTNCATDITQMKTRKGLALVDVVRELQP